jgi:hypothetical protein
MSVAGVEHGAVVTGTRGADVPERIRQYREQYRRERVPGYYSGIFHLGFTSVASIAVVVFCIIRIHDVTALEWLTIPVTFLYANLAEYLGHRGPMHHPFGFLRLIYERHTLQHHRFFTDKAMQFDSSRDFHAVLFPPVLMVFFISAFALPVWLLLVWLFSANVAYLFVATAIAYFLNYELLHFAYHTAPDSWISRLPGMHVLRKLHSRHHDPALMQRHNFNITYPIGDLIFGTLFRRPDENAGAKDQGTP